MSACTAGCGPSALAALQVYIPLHPHSHPHFAPFCFILLILVHFVLALLYFAHAEIQFIILNFSCS